MSEHWFPSPSHGAGAHWDGDSLLCCCVRNFYVSSIFPYSVCKQNMAATALAAAVLWQLLQRQGSFAAIRLDGSVVTWGIPRSGGDSTDVQDQLLGPVSNGNVLHMNHEKPAVDKDVGTKLLDLLMKCLLAISWFACLHCFYVCSLHSFFNGMAQEYPHG